MSIRRLSFFTIALTVGLIGFGELVPDLKGGILLAAYVVIGAILGVITIILYGKVLRAKVRPVIRKAANGMMVLLAMLVLVEAFDMWFEVPMFVSAGHFLVEMLFLACVCVLWRQSTNHAGHRVALSNQQQEKITRHVKMLLALAFVFLCVGAYVKHDSTGDEFIQTIHRVLGVMLAMYSLLLMYWSFAKDWGTPIQKRMRAVLVLQFLMLVTVLDTSIGTLLFAIVAETSIFMATLVKEKGKLVPFVIKQLPMKNGKSGSYSGQR